MYDAQDSSSAMFYNDLHIFVLQNVFDGMKKRANRKTANNKKTGAALQPLDNVDELIMDFEGRESNFMIGMQLPDKPPVFQNQEGEDSSDDNSMADPLTGNICFDFKIANKSKCLFISQHSSGSLNIKD